MLPAVPHRRPKHGKPHRVVPCLRQTKNSSLRAQAKNLGLGSGYWTSGLMVIYTRLLLMLKKIPLEKVEEILVSQNSVGHVPSA